MSLGPNEKVKQKRNSLINSAGRFSKLFETAISFPLLFKEQSIILTVDKKFKQKSEFDTTFKCQVFIKTHVENFRIVLHLFHTTNRIRTM